MARKRISGLIGDITTITSNLSIRLGGGELQQLAPFQAELETWLAEARGLESQHEFHTARLRENTQQKRLIELPLLIAQLRSCEVADVAGHKPIVQASGL